MFQFSICIPHVFSKLPDIAHSICYYRSHRNILERSLLIKRSNIIKNIIQILPPKMFGSVVQNTSSDVINVFKFMNASEYFRLSPSSSSSSMVTCHLRWMI